MSQEWNNMDTEAIARAIEANAGMALPDLRQSLAQAKAGQVKTTTAEQLIVRTARKATGLSQAEFAERINTPVRTLQEWEQGRATPQGAVLYLMQLIKENPHTIDTPKVA